MPRPAETTSTRNAASPGEYQLVYWAKGVFGKAKVHATQATVAAVISHTGQCAGHAGRAFPAPLSFVAKAIHTVSGVAARKHQNGSQRPTGLLSMTIGPTAAIALT